MLTTGVDSHIYYTHTDEEVAELATAIIPMMDSIAAVASPHERHNLRRIVEGKHFRLQHARIVRAMLLRACKHARAHLGEYFPLLQHDVLVHTQHLEDAVNAYWLTFKRLREQAVVVP